MVAPLSMREDIGHVGDSAKARAKASAKASANARANASDMGYASS